MKCERKKQKMSPLNLTMAMRYEAVNLIYFIEVGIKNQRFNPKSKNRTTQTPNPQSKPKKCTPFKPCLQQNTGIFSKFDKTGVNYPIFWII
jgi:hypothetical protein